jgi:hypothetical protein
MITCTLVLRQVLGEWSLVVSLHEDHGFSGGPEASSGAYHYPLTASEWDADALSAVLSALRRWSDMTSRGHPAGSVSSPEKPQGLTVVGGPGGGEAGTGGVR